MSDLGDLYQQVILDHNRNPRNFRPVPGANRAAEGYNPLCGDRISLEVRLEDDVIRDIGFQGSGCAISKAAASLMTAAVLGKPTAEAEVLFQAFRDMLAGGAAAPGKLVAFAGVRAFPARVKCANLSWHTLHAALQNRPAPAHAPETVTTESPND